MLARRPLALAATLVALVSAGCGGGGEGDGVDARPATTDIGGWYEAVELRMGDCGATIANPDAPAYIWVEPFSDIYYLRYCTTTAEADCYATPFYDFIEPITGGWHAEGGSAFFSAGCTLSWQRTDATLDGEQLEVRALSYLVTDDAASAADCTLEAAEALTEPCTYEIGITATRR